MTPYERAKETYQALHGRMATSELKDRDIAIIKTSIESAIIDERRECERVAENHYLSMTEILHQDLSNTEKAIGMNIARCIRDRGHRRTKDTSSSEQDSSRDIERVRNE